MLFVYFILLRFVLVSASRIAAHFKFQGKYLLRSIRFGCLLLTIETLFFCFPQKSLEAVAVPMHDGDVVTEFGRVGLEVQSLVAECRRGVVEALNIRGM